MQHFAQCAEMLNYKERDKKGKESEAPKGKIEYNESKPIKQQ